MTLPVLLLLAACGRADPADQAKAEAEDHRIDCRIAGADQFERFCTIEYVENEAGRTLVVRKPDGGFRRLLVTGDGRGVAAADGAEPAQVTIIADDRIEVAIGGDTFRLPATVRRP
jgi:hypothetical protein